MKPRYFALMCAALCVCTSAYAADKKPVPEKPPARVPFSAFRMKPILNPELSKTVIRDEARKKKAVVVTKMAPPPAKPETETMSAPPPEPPQKIDLHDKAIAPEGSDVIFMAGIPVPPRKPVDPDAPLPIAVHLREDLAERGLPRMSPQEEPVPQAPVPESEVSAGIPPPHPEPPAQTMPQTPQQQAEEAASTAAVDPEQTQDENEALYRPPPQPVGTERIRDTDRDRFSSQKRSAGAGLGNWITRSLSRDKSSLRVGPLEQAQGISPVLLPGETVTLAAPDYQPISNNGVPNDVIVFFQENSPEMEVGQMDVLNNDVIQVMRDHPELNLEIDGYSESLAGGLDATRKMSLSRALMVREYLARQHIPGNRLTVQGKGDNTQVEPRDRVEMTFSL